jgi:alkanesulfonate monooxygenase SsuD/methylene tetrahydromethanopterin reductase-like flavin-dependent oxidoreductase (luciferase family)
MTQLGVLYDMRNADRPDRPYETFYREVLDQAAALPGLGFDSIWITEHHCTDDGYTPSPLPLLAAMAQRAPDLQYGTNIMIAPLHHPLRIAEDAATLAVLTEGRFTLGLGGGYSKQEFDGFGANIRHRPSLMTESIEILRRAFTGERFSFSGRRYQLTDARVTPAAQTPPRIFLGGLSKPAADRAVAIADGFMGAWPDSLDAYGDALERAGRPRTDGAIGGLPVWWVIAEDPERDWARVGDHALYQINTYVKWGAFPEAYPDRDALLASGIWQCFDGARAVDELVALVQRYPQIEDIHVFGALPGEPVDGATERLRYIADTVLPSARERLAELSLGANGANGANGATPGNLEGR